MLWSALFALCIAYVIWYTGVQRIGSSRTSIYSNLTPIVAMIGVPQLAHARAVASRVWTPINGKPVAR